MNKLIIIGAGGHGKVIADNALKNGYKNIGFIDDNCADTCMGFPVVGTTGDIENLNDGETDFIIGIGNNTIRQSIAEKYDVNWVTIIHPSAQIAVSASVGKGTVVMANAVINASATVGAHCIINTGSIVEHDNVIEDYVHLSPRVALGGEVKIGADSHIGIGAAVSNNIEICDNCIIGASAVVVNNIRNKGTYVGIPARKNR